VSEPSPPTELDTSIAHPARVYDYWLGGKDNFPADRAAAEAVLAANPDGLELLDPGVVQPPLWRPDGPVSVDLERVSFYAGLGRKP
jgi:hypothetical protein